MKTKLLLLVALLNSVFSFSQIAFQNFSRTIVNNTSITLNADVIIDCATGATYTLQVATSTSFSPLVASIPYTDAATLNKTMNVSGLSPNTIYYWRLYGSLGTGCNTTVVYSPNQTFSTNPPIGFKNLTHTPIDATSVDVHADIDINCPAGASYTLQLATSLAYSPLIQSIPFTDMASLTKTISLTNLTPNTLYYWRLYGSQGSGCNTGTVYSSNGIFTTQQVEVEYRFDNTLTNTNNTNPFTSSGALTFVNDRHGNPNSALNMNNVGAVATNLGFNYGNGPQTISMWVKINSFASYNFLFRSGFATVARMDASTVRQQMSTPEHVVNTTNEVNTWYHFVFVYDRFYSKIYKDGVLLESVLRDTWYDSQIGEFQIGYSTTGLQGYFNGAVDDLKIFNRALSQTEITNLFTNNTLASQNFNQNNLKVSLHPNPATDILNIEMTNEVKSVEIYSLQGQKVMEATQNKSTFLGFQKECI